MKDMTDKRILIVEDNFLIGEMIAETISAAGGRPLGPLVTETEALDMIDYDPRLPDAAILDIGLDRRSFGVAKRLQRLGIPFIFATGSPRDIPAEYRDALVCAKPYTPGELLAALAAILHPKKDRYSAAA